MTVRARRDPVSSHRPSRQIAFWPDLAELDQFQAERFSLREDAEYRGPILEQAGEHGLSAVDVGNHRRKGRKGGGPEAALDPNAVQVVPSVHDFMVRGGR